jgi:hypothetical protein
MAYYFSKQDNQRDIIPSEIRSRYYARSPLYTDRRKTVAPNSRQIYLAVFCVIRHFQASTYLKLFNEFTVSLYVTLKSINLLSSCVRCLRDEQTKPHAISRIASLYVGARGLTIQAPISLQIQG